MNNNKLESLLMELKIKVRESSGKIREEELINMITLIARTEMKLRQNDNSFGEEYEKEILKFISNDKFRQENSNLNNINQ